MDIGAFIFATGYTIAVDELARELEARGFESLFVPEHTHIPVSRKSPFPGGGDLPRQYWHTHDPFVSLSFAAAATQRLKLGTGICLIPQRDPIVTAKSVASLDMLSGGRFLLGMGGGWNVEEMEDHGAEYRTRFKLLRERVLAMKALWADEEAEFHGEFVDFDPCRAYPKPVQKPHPPLLLGGETDHTLRRVVEFCDGWFPRGTRRIRRRRRRRALAPHRRRGRARHVRPLHQRVRRQARPPGNGRIPGGRRYARHNRPALRQPRRRAPPPRQARRAAWRLANRLLRPRGRRRYHGSIQGRRSSSCVQALRGCVCKRQ